MTKLILLTLLCAAMLGGCYSEIQTRDYFVLWFALSLVVAWFSSLYVLRIISEHRGDWRYWIAWSIFNAFIVAWLIA